MAKVGNGLLDMHATRGAGDNEIAAWIRAWEEGGVELRRAIGKRSYVKSAAIGLDVKGVELGEAAVDAAAGSFDVKACGKERGGLHAA